MRNTVIANRYPIVVKTISLPPDRAGDIKRSVRGTALAQAFVTEFVERFMEDAHTAADKAWDECSVLLGFQDSDDLHRQGYQAVLNGGLLELRTEKEGAADA